jgi:hypothetical protein
MGALFAFWVPPVVVHDLDVLLHIAYSTSPTLSRMSAVSW